jgi:flagellar biosynthesis/type III secretory pathway ATPase
MRTITVLLKMVVRGKTKTALIVSLVGEVGIAVQFCAVQLADSSAILKITSIIWDSGF